MHALCSSFFVYHLDTSPTILKKIIEDCHHDNDMIRSYYLKKEYQVPDDYECTLEEEFKPPALRKSVQGLIEEGRKKKPVYDAGDPHTNPLQIS